MTPTRSSLSIFAAALIALGSLSPLALAQDEGPQEGAGDVATPRKAPAKAPIPPARDIAPLRRKAEESYKVAELEDREDKREAASRMLADAATFGDEPSTQYVVYLLAYDLSVAGRKLPLVLEVVDALDACFTPIDVEELHAEAVIALGPHVQRTEIEDFAAFGLELAELDLAAENATRAERLLKAMKSRTNRFASPAAKQRLSEDQKVLEALAGYLEAKKVLVKSPGDETANQTVGHYIGFVRGEIEGALPFLTKGAKGSLRTCAVADLATPTEPAAQRDLGSQWKKFGEAQNGRVRAVAEKRAEHWWRLSLVGLPALDQVVVKDWLSELEQVAEAEEAGRGGDRVSNAGRALRSRTRGLDKSAGAMVERGLDWLVAHQSEAGSWDADEFFRACDHEECEGGGDANHDVGVTGLALMALQSVDARGGARGAAIDMAVAWLLDQQDSETGLLGDEIGHAFLYDHAIGTIALCDALARGHAGADRASCQKAVNYAARARNPYRVWRYESPPNGENDTSVTVWMIQALTAAESAGLKVDRSAYSAAIEWLDEMTDPGTGRVGYTEIGSASSRDKGMNDHYPTASGEALTAAALAARVRLGQRPSRVPHMRAHMELLLKEQPTIHGSDESEYADLYYLYHGSEAMNGIRSTSPKPWRTWYDQLKDTLGDLQSTDGHAKGSWAPTGPWGYEGGRVYSTSMAILALTAPGR